MRRPLMRLRNMAQRALQSTRRTINGLAGRFGRPDVVFIGDSITRFWLDDDPALFRGRRVNAGISGETSANMLARFHRDVVARKPRAVHIMAGTNDLWHGVPGPMASVAIANLAEMAAIARANGIRAIVAAPPPIAPHAADVFGHADLFPALYEAIRAHCRDAALDHVDYAKSLTGADGLLRPEYTTDGVHLTRRGYLAMRAQAEQALNRR